MISRVGASAATEQIATDFGFGPEALTTEQPWNMRLSKMYR